MSDIYLIKPSRFSDDTQLLTQNYIDANHQRGLETDIFLDLNIISKMRKVMKGEEVYENTFLPKIVEIFSNLKGFYLSPGYALQESDKKYREDNYRTLEVFLFNFLPNCQNAYNSQEIKLDSTYIEQYFAKFDQEYNNHTKLYYASLLTIYHLNLIFEDVTVPAISNYSNLNFLQQLNLNDSKSLIKFQLYLNSMSAHHLGSLELLIAQLVFLTGYK